MTTTSRGLGAVLVAQFLSALADNALLFAAIALLKATAAPAWHTPLLQEGFLLAYILLAPFVGHIADTWAKGRVMLAANALKLAGAGVMLLGANPVLAYALVGVGAAAYSPAKYGILSEFVPPDKLVKANGLLEGSTIAAILLGVVLGGYLADQKAQLAVAFTVGVYFLAALANLRIPKSAAVGGQLRSPRALVGEFWSALRTLMRSQDGRFTLLGTSLFWGTGSTLRFILVAWVPVALGIADTAMPANLSGAVAVGIAVGAAAASRFVTLSNVNRALPAGLALGSLIIAFATVTSLPVAVGMLVLIGACGGFYVVPLNALLQEKGHESVGAGSAIAVQNFVENLLMLVMVGAYTAMARAGLSPVSLAMAFGGIVLLGIGSLAWSRVKPQGLPATASEGSSMR
ncbi:MFS transporter, LPLT family, lysophospholipid transporter [Novimethylophilus kurashikiensis]|uniref:MFS transporter, LPLT family, lysophospholipid transporter n=1 Tax=Novimethylophilus kurashikiensis TaxID=1825523 RepID=A0A2R5F8M7_9PROT|nr:lysophospholipid transporter LplT [Novimethylophilus kurashikiensis]GBG14600.1 MFS transporter, LPLT family, lysophospholipid transporter [Novimethylophilus kurashikiensis]